MSYKIEGRKSDDTYSQLLPFSESLRPYLNGAYSPLDRPVTQKVCNQNLNGLNVEPLPKPAEWRSKKKLSLNFWTRAAQNNWFLYLYLYVSESRMCVG